MGKLRVEPKIKTIAPAEYNNLLAILTDAQKQCSNSSVYYDLEEHEDAVAIRKNLLYVAEREGITLTVRRKRGSNTLKLEFAMDQTRPSKGSRLTPEATKARILEVLKSGDTLKKAVILKSAGINGGAWNIRIRELIESGQVIRTGTRRETTYKLAKV